LKFLLFRITVIPGYFLDIIILYPAYFLSFIVISLPFVVISNSLLSSSRKYNLSPSILKFNVSLFVLIEKVSCPNIMSSNLNFFSSLALDFVISICSFKLKTLSLEKILLFEKWLSPTKTNTTTITNPVNPIQYFLITFLNNHNANIEAIATPKYPALELHPIQTNIINTTAMADIILCFFSFTPKRNAMDRGNISVAKLPTKFVLNNVPYIVFGPNENESLSTCKFPGIIRLFPILVWKKSNPKYCVMPNNPSAIIRNKNALTNKVKSLSLFTKLIVRNVIRT